MNLQRLRYFEAVARLRSFRRAADELNISQPALSRQINVLEGEIGVALLIRSKRRVTVTPGGEHLWRKCGELLDGAAVLAKEVRRISDAEPVPLTIGVLQSLLTGTFPQAYMAWRREVGKVRLRVFGFRSSHIISGVLNGEYDLGIVSVPVNDERLVATELYQDTHVAVLPRGHRLARRAAVNLRLLAAADPIVTWPQGFGIRESIDQASVDFPIRSYAAEVESLGAILELVRAGLGATVLPLSAVTPPPRGVLIRRIEGKSIDRTVSSIYRVGVALPPSTQRLLELMTKAALEGRQRFDAVRRR
jgi:DNA-binding transcriptional LysR family regulator